MNIFTDNELRYMAIRLLGAPTGRTLQTRIGASDLANECDRCLAMAMGQIERARSPRAEAIWMQKEIGTGIHAVQEHRIAETGILQELGISGVRAEQRLRIGTIPGYGDIFGTIDVSMPHQIVDWKGSDRVKGAFLHDFLLSAGLLPEGTKPRWVKQKDTARYEGGYKFEYGSSNGAKRVAQISARGFREAMDSMVHKMNGYHIQQTLYMHGRHLAGQPAYKGSIIWINRDGNGVNDVPEGSRYEDPTAIHDVWVLSFDYHEQTALDALARGERVWKRLEAGAMPEDFDADPACFFCSFEKENIADIAPDIEAKLAA